MVHRRSINDQVIVFGNQGALWGNAMTMFDHETGSVWSQPLGEAILGPARGADTRSAAFDTHDVGRVEAHASRHQSSQRSRQAKRVCP